MIKKHLRIFVPALLPLVLAMVSCGENKTAKIETGHAESGGDQNDHGARESGASYEEGKGISLSGETLNALEVEVAEVEEQDLEPTIRLTAQVYRAAAEASRVYGMERNGNAYATALVSKEVVDQMASGQKISFLPQGGGGSTHSGSVMRVDTAQLPILGKGEALLELPDELRALQVGAFVEARVFLGKTPRKVISIPKPAVLETSTGKYAFVQNGRFLLRTEIKTGAWNEDNVEITEGLYAGDMIALKAVENLYLIELRATKGGGHSH